MPKEGRSMERKDFLFFKESELYTIKLKNREDGYYYCCYQVSTSQEHIMVESSGRKIWLRLIHAFSLYKKDLTESQINEMKEDLSLIAEGLKIPGKNDF
jgi:hypothetical protein